MTQDDLLNEAIAIKNCDGAHGISAYSCDACPLKRRSKNRACGDIFIDDVIIFLKGQIIEGGHSNDGLSDKTLCL